MPVIDPYIAQNKQQFDQDYLTANPDVAKAGMDAYEHYIKYGKAEGRKYGDQQPGLISGKPPQQAPKLSKEDFFKFLPGMTGSSPEAQDQIYADYEKWLGTVDFGMFR